MRQKEAAMRFAQEVDVAKQERQFESFCKGGDGISTLMKPRPRRFNLQIELRYRARGEGQWYTGTTRNISCSGILFQGEELFEPTTPLEMNLKLPKETMGARAAEVMCQGMVMRSEGPVTEDDAPLMASIISHFRFVRP